MTLSGLGLLTMWECPCGDVSSLYLVFLKLFYLLYSGLLVFPLVISCLQNLHFAMIIYHPTFGFFSFLAVSITDEPVNRSIHAYALTQLDVFALRVFIFFDIHKKTRKELSNSGYKIQIKKGWKVYSRTRTFGATEHKSNIRVKRWHNTMSTKIVNWTENHNFCSNDFLTKSNRTEIQTYKVEERTFRTPCIHTVEVLLATTLVSDQL